MKLFIKKYLILLCLGMVLQTTPVVGMEQKPQQPSTAALVTTLGAGVVRTVASMYLTAQAMAYCQPAGQTLDDTLFDGARYLIPAALAGACYSAQQIAEQKDRLAQIRTGSPSMLWSQAGSFCSSAKIGFMLGGVFGGLDPTISSLYKRIGSAVATTCSAAAAASPAVCSYVADKTADLATTLASRVAVGRAMVLLPHDTPQLRTKKSELMATRCAGDQASDEQAAGVFSKTNEPKTVSSLGGIQLQGPQIYYFLVSHGCDLEKLWWKFLSQAQQIKASKDGTWQQLCAQRLDHLKKSITASFEAAQKKLSKTVSSVAELINPVMPFGQYPQQFSLDKKYLEQEPASGTYSVSVAKEPRAIFEGIMLAVLSYFEPACMQVRNEQGDEALFNPPLTPVFITVDGAWVTITAYPQSRQDRMYPHQWQTAVTYPRWFNQVNKMISLAIAFRKPLIFELVKPNNYFLPDGTRCFMRDGQAFCDGDTARVLTTCFSYRSCLEEFVSKRPSVDGALVTLELDPRQSYTERDIKMQFRNLTRVHHPDKNPQDPMAHERFIQIKEAYNYLCQRITNK